MKVIGAGFGRTGTMSLKVALEELGAGPCLHSLEARRADSGLASHWEQLANGQPVDWHKAFEGWGSTVDWLGARFYPQMLQAWPQAKVILSVRDPEDWYESCHASLHATRELAGGLGGTDEVVPVLKAIDSAIWEDIFDGRFDERDHALEVFERHRLQVARVIPAERLLIYDIREGWQPLCDFLGVPVPKTPFPHLNGRDAFWTRFGSRPTRRGNGHSAAGNGAAGNGATGNGASPGAHPQQAAPMARGAGEPSAPRITGISTTDPGVTLDQAQMLDLLGLSDDEFAQRIFGRCGVQRRRMHLTPQMLSQPLQGRTAEVEDRLLSWSVEAVEQLNVDPGQIGTIVSATLYSLGGPTLAHRLGEHFQMDPSVDKYHLSGVGCASAVPLIRLAQGALPNHPGKQCLIIGAESMSGLLAHASEGDPRSKTVGSAIFGDGCAAMLLGSGEQGDGPSVLASQVHQIPDSLGAVCMQLGPQDSYLHLIRELPDVAGEHVGGLVERFLASQGMTGHMIDHWMIHPGGRRIIECAQQALRLPDEHVKISFDLLAERGNVGTPSIFYVIAETIRLREPRPDEYGLAVTIGPGVSVGLMLLRW